MNFEPSVNDKVINDYSLNSHLMSGFNNTMGFLNDIQSRFPFAISFVAGRPDENYFNIREMIAAFDQYVNYLSCKTKDDGETVANRIGQYQSSKGIINDIIAVYLKNDEEIEISPQHLLITVGAQEAFAIVVSAICNPDQDVILMEDPSYIGLSSFAKIYGYPLEGVKSHSDGIDLQDLRRLLDAHLAGGGKRVKLLYVIPDYQNPSGTCMSMKKRIDLLRLADEYNFLIVEDGVYNNFNYQDAKKPTLKSLDQNNKVIYIGSFAKLLFPGLRLGLIAADQMLIGKDGQLFSLIDQMEKVKAQLTNNTPSIDQAMLGGLLIKNGFSMRASNVTKLENYRNKRNRMLNALDRYIGFYEDGWAKNITWNRPEGGFFIKMELPIIIAEQHVADCAEKFGVIFCPMKDFYFNSGGEMELRLSFSSQPVEKIDEGIAALAQYLKSRIKEE